MRWDTETSLLRELSRTFRMTGSMTFETAKPIIDYQNSIIRF